MKYILLFAINFISISIKSSTNIEININKEQEDQQKKIKKQKYDKNNEVKEKQESKEIDKKKQSNEIGTETTKPIKKIQINKNFSNKKFLPNSSLGVYGSISRGEFCDFNNLDSGADYKILKSIISIYVGARRHWGPTENNTCNVYDAIIGLKYTQKLRYNVRLDIMLDYGINEKTPNFAIGLSVQNV